MNDINMLIFIISAVDIINTLKNYFVLKRDGGNKQGSFKHFSDMKIVSLALLVLSAVFCIWILISQREYIIGGIMLVVCMGIKTFDHNRDIEVFENGMFLNGRFISWGNIKSIVEYEKNSIRIEHKKKTLLCEIANRVEGRPELMRLYAKVT